MAFQFTSLDRLRVFAVEDHAVQLTWGRRGADTAKVRLGDDERDLTDQPDGGSVTFTGLTADRDHTFVVEGSRPGSRRSLMARTLPSPPGAELYRFATVSDIHIGIDHFDLFHRITEDPGLDGPPHATRCTAAALRELEAWGAERLVVKGDLTESSLAEEWRDVGDVLRACPVPTDVLPGNHDHRRDGEGVTTEDGAGLAGIDLRRGVQFVDVAGARLVFVETPGTHHHRGTMPTEVADEAVAAVGDAPAAIVLMHHQPQTTRVPLFWPPGIPYGQTRYFLDGVRRANPRVLVTSGHTHRHRRRDAGPLVLTEVGSPKDYPGAWGGYVVHEGGVRQVVRRVEAPECTPWLERTRRAALGAWGHWSPGRLEDRCFTHPWP